MTYRECSFDETAFIANYQLFCSHTEGECGAAIKGNAYGTGVERAVRLLEQADCQHYFVATASEGIQIRDLTQETIYVLSGPTDPEVAQEIRNHSLVPVLNSPTQIQNWQPFHQNPVAVHVDTGMQRLGFDTQTLPIQELSQFDIKLLMTHLACANEQRHPLNTEQIKKFREVSEQFPGIPTSIGNSAGTLLGVKYQGDVTRPGIGLYGGNPFSDRPSPVQPVVSIYGRVLQVRNVNKGESIGYGGSYVAPSDQRIAVVGVGYADGLPRALSNRGEAAFEGKRLPIVGKVTMDSVQVNCTDLHNLAENDYVEFIGPTISVDEVAEWSNSIAYEILTLVGNATTRE